MFWAKLLDCQPPMHSTLQQTTTHCNTLQHTATHSHHEVINWIKHILISSICSIWANKASSKATGLFLMKYSQQHQPTTHAHAHAHAHAHPRKHTHTWVSQSDGTHPRTYTKVSYTSATIFARTHTLGCHNQMAHTHKHAPTNTHKGQLRVSHNTRTHARAHTHQHTHTHTHTHA